MARTVYVLYLSPFVCEKDVRTFGTLQRYGTGEVTLLKLSPLINCGIEGWVAWKRCRYVMLINEYLDTQTSWLTGGSGAIICLWRKRSTVYSVCVANNKILSEILSGACGIASPEWGCVQSSIVQCLNGDCIHGEHCSASPRSQA